MVVPFGFFMVVLWRLTSDVVVLLFVVCSDSNLTQLSDRDEEKLRPHWGNGGHGDHH